MEAKVTCIKLDAEERVDEAPVILLALDVRNLMRFIDVDSITVLELVQAEEGCSGLIPPPRLEAVQPSARKERINKADGISRINDEIRNGEECSAMLKVVDSGRNGE